MGRGRVFVGSLYYDMLDVLDMDGGWLTVGGLENMFPCAQAKTMRRTLQKAASRGEVEARPRPTNEKMNSEYEYRITEVGSARLAA